jgi:phosphohistidine phosphatase
MDEMTVQRHLIVMRHAKAGELPGGPDADRALRPRGRRDAQAAGRWLAARGLIPAQVLCSTAVRARQTWEHVSDELGDAEGSSAVSFDPRLYVADARQVLDIVSGAAAEAGSLMYVGHNPAAADLAEILTARPADLPTAAIAVIGLQATWPELATGEADGTGELVAYWTPQGSS